MTDKLTVYKLALSFLGERQINSLTEPREPRRILDSFYDTAAGYCLAQGMWAHAIRVSGALTQVAGALGYDHGYTRPTDVIYLQSIGPDATFNAPIDRDYALLGSTIYTNTAALYVRYTSNDATSGGMNLTNWTAGFTSYVAATLARMSAMRITRDPKAAELMQSQEDRFYAATYAVDSVELPSGLLPMNAEARSPTSGEPVPAMLLPFAAQRALYARMMQQQPQR